MTVIGLTGGIASGKSTAAGWMKELGAIVIDADRLGHRVYEPGSPGFQAVVNEFGHDLVQADGTINRQLLGGRVFGDPDQMKRLTDIVWPEIRRLAKLDVTELKRRDKNAAIVLEAAVLVEANWFDLVDEVWVVTVDPAIARARLMSRNSLTEAQAQARIDSQISNKQRSLLAFAKLDNSGTLDEFHQAVDKEWKKLARRAGFTVATPPPAPVTSAAARKTGARPAAAKATAIASKTSTAKATPVKASAVKAAPAGASTSKPAAKPASAARPAVKAAPAKAGVSAAKLKAAPARAASSASTQSASTRTGSPRTAAPPAAAPRAAAAQAKATAAKATAVKRTAAKPAPVASARRAATVKRVAAKTPARPTRPAVRPEARPMAKLAARPAAGRRAGAK